MLLSNISELMKERWLFYSRLERILQVLLFVSEYAFNEMSLSLFAVVNQLLKYQSATLGLFPLHTSNRNKEAHIRDNIYCATSIWGLSLAYRCIEEFVLFAKNP